MSKDAVYLDRDGAVATIHLNRPDKRNALHPGVIDGIREGLRRLQEMPG